MPEESDRGRSANRLWWADALNPGENLRALADVQEFGRRAAEDLADRLLARGGRDGTSGDASLPDAELNELIRRFRAEAVRAADDCAPLRSHLGYELPPDAIRFEPRALDPLPARSSCGIEVRLSVPSAAPPGTYVSVVLASNVPELYLPLRVTVKPEGVDA